MSDTYVDPTHVHIATVPPSACSACFGQYTDRVHVDFGASWDGPFLTGQVTGGTAVSIDELVICEECLRTGARLLGLVDPGEESEQVVALTARLEQMGEFLSKKDEENEHLLKALAAKPRGRPPKGA